MERIYRMLVINPGSTSTKISVFENRKNLFTDSIFHDAPELLSYGTVSEQLPMRRKVVLDFLAENGIDINDIDVFIGRGGCAYSQKEGVMRIDRKLYEDTRDDKGGSDHPAKLGVMMAYQFGTEYGKPMYTVDPTNVDELDDIARITGISGVYRRAQSHVLNQKGVARIHAHKMGRRYDECRFIICHIDGGITVNAHRYGKMVDGTEGAGGEGAFTPTRIGSVPALELARYVKTHVEKKTEELCSRSGGGTAGSWCSSGQWPAWLSSDWRISYIWPSRNGFPPIWHIPECLWISLWFPLWHCFSSRHCSRTLQRERRSSLHLCRTYYSLQHTRLQEMSMCSLRHWSMLPCQESRYVLSCS